MNRTYKFDKDACYIVINRFTGKFYFELGFQSSIYYRYQYNHNNSTGAGIYIFIKTYPKKRFEFKGIKNYFERQYLPKVLDEFLNEYKLNFDTDKEIIKLYITILVNEITKYLTKKI